MGHRHQQADRMKCSFAEYNTASTDHLHHINKNVFTDTCTSNEGEVNLLNSI